LYRNQLFQIIIYLKVNNTLVTHCPLVQLFFVLEQILKQPDLLQDRFDVAGKTRHIAIQLVLQQCCKTSCKFFVARFFVPLLICWIVLLDTTFASANEFSEEFKISHLPILRLTFAFFFSSLNSRGKAH